MLLIDIFIHNYLEYMDVNIESSWKEVLNKVFQTSSFKDLVSFVKTEYKNGIVYPPGEKIFNAFNCCPLGKVKVVIIGQDPYHGPGQANGLCFSVNEGIKPPPSLMNIFKELRDDIGKDISSSGNLEHWAKQGVLMLNATLTVRARSAGSHQKKGWEEFTDEVIKIVSKKKEGVVFILWGAYAQKKGEVIDRSKHCVISSPHPSPFSAHSGFFGSKPFSKTNEYLKKYNREIIQW